VFVARSSVRVALNRSGLQATWGAARFADCLVVRNALEPTVCQDAAAHHGEDDVTAMHRILDEMARHVDDARAYLEHNWALHRRIAKLCRNAPLHSIYLTLLDFLEDGLAAGELNEFDGRADLELHRELVAAIEDGPGSRLDAVVARHTNAPTLLRPSRAADRTRPSAA
jgi:DNA-binding FadR family transcriptional regulator